MASEAVTTYLNDHLAGSTAALQLLDHLVDTAERPDDKRFFVTLRAAVTEDRDTLQHVMRRVGGRESSLRHVGGWIAEKAVRLKLMYDDPASRTLAPLEGLSFLLLTSSTSVHYGGHSRRRGPTFQACRNSTSCSLRSEPTISTGASRRVAWSRRARC